MLRRPVTSLTTTDPLRKSRPMKASMAWANETRLAKVSSARWVCGGGREGKVHAMHRGFGLRDGACAFLIAVVITANLARVRGGNP